jgi:MFS family permease
VRAVTKPVAIPSLWANVAFRRVWAAETVSIFGSFVTRMALPLVAILVLGADALGVALIPSMDLVAGLVVGLIAGAWVDRLRRRPVLIWTDLGRAALLATIPIAAGTGLTEKQVMADTFLTDYVDMCRRASPYVSFLCGAVGLEF